LNENVNSQYSLLIDYNNLFIETQFRATLKWNQLISHLFQNVEIKERKLSKKNTCSCFSGSNAIDVLHRFVTSNPHLFPHTPPLPRRNITKLCEAFTHKGVLLRADDVIGSKEQFEDSSRVFFKFSAETEKSQEDKEQKEVDAKRVKKSPASHRRRLFSFREPENSRKKEANGVPVR